MIHLNTLPLKGTSAMKSHILAAALLAGALSLTACGPKAGVEGSDITSSSSPAAIGAAYVTEMTRIADALDTVKDEESARAAAIEIRKAADGLKTMEEALGGDMSGLRAMQILGSNYQGLVAAQTRMMTSMMRIQSENPELMNYIGEEMDRLND